MAWSKLAASGAWVAAAGWPAWCCLRTAKSLSLPFPPTLVLHSMGEAEVVEDEFADIAKLQEFGIGAGTGGVHVSWMWRASPRCVVLALREECCSCCTLHAAVLGCCAVHFTDAKQLWMSARVLHMGIRSCFACPEQRCSIQSPPAPSRR
jgi:hypothetical protein